MKKINYVVVEDKYNEGNWAVEAIDGKRVLGYVLFLEIWYGAESKEICCTVEKEIMEFGKCLGAKVICEKHGELAFYYKTGRHSDFDWQRKVDLVIKGHKHHEIEGTVYHIIWNCDSIIEIKEVEVKEYIIFV